jgi:hypothetical protein
VASELAAQAAADSDSLPGAEKKNFLITPFIAPGYTPEMGFLVTVGGLISFRTRPPIKSGTLRELVQRSTLTVNGTYSTTGAITANLKLSSFWKGDRFRILADFSLKEMPDHYWGVGYEAGKAPEGDSTTAYQRSSWAILPKVLWRVSEQLFVGGAFDFNYTRASDVSPGVADDPYYQSFGPVNQNGGMGVIIQYDTRDVAANAWNGLYLGAQALAYGSFLGSDNDYLVYDIDYRQYRSIGRQGRTLAWTVRTRLSYGDVPWAELSQLGTSNDLRGYRLGRYRDKTMLYGIVEYRHQFTSRRRESGLSRHGLVGWIGAGAVAPRLAELNDWLPNWGVGYRFEAQPRLSVRIDLGFGKEFYAGGEKYVPSVYFNFTEAF